MKISYSMRQSMKTCPRKVYWKYYAGIEPKIEESIAKVIGKTFHFGLENLRLSKDISLAINLAKDELKRHIYDENTLKENIAKMEVYISCYEDKYFDTHRDWYGVELEINTDGEIAFIDGIIKDLNGELILVEDKTRSILSKNTNKSQKMSDQLLNYCDLMRHRDVDVRRCLYRETQKSKLKFNSKVNESNILQRLYDEYYLLDKFQETELTFTKYEIDNYAEEKLFFSKYIDMCCAENDREKWPRHSDNCVNMYGACEYLDLCTNQKNAIENYKINDKEPLDDGLTRKKLGLNHE